MTVEQMKAWIDSQDYETLLRHWRFAPAGSSWFQGETGDYYSNAMREKSKVISADERVRASKNIGWL